MEKPPAGPDDLYPANEPERAAGGSSPAGRLAGTRPYLRQCWLNLRVWLPFLMNPHDKERSIRYWSREKREGLEWKVGLPKQCCRCGTTEGLSRRRWEFQVRNFEYPLAIFGVTAIAVLLLSLALWVSSAGLFTALLTLLGAVAIGGCFVWVKSWREDVRLTMYVCPAHAEGLEQPEAAVFDEELYLFLPSPSLAEAAQQELDDERRRGGRRGPASVPADNRPPEMDAPAPPPRISPPRPPVKELPPIKLEGDD